MAVDLASAIQASKDIMSTSDEVLFNRRGFSRFDRSYFSTSENIKAYLDNVSFNKGKALSVLASGDQVFNLICKGVNDIDTFDINELAYFTFYLRRALMLRFPSKGAFVNAQQDFLSNSSTSFQNIYSSLPSLREFIPADVYLYFEELLKFNIFKNRGFSSLFYKLYRGCGSNYDKFNLYMQDKEAFKKLVDGVAKAKISFIPGDIRVIRDRLDKTYDIMLFSNIVDYNFLLNHLFEVIKFKEFLASFDANLASDGVIINYLMSQNSEGLTDFNLPYSEFGCNYTEELKDVDSEKSADSFYLVRKK